MSPVKRHITLGGYQLTVAEGEPQPFRRAHLSVFVPRTEITGQPGADNLDSGSWVWATTDFANGEGALVFNPRSTDERGFPFPSFKSTDGAVDVRTRGEFKMSPVPSLVTNTGGATTTTTQGSAMTTDSGSPTFDADFPVVETRATSASTTTTTSHTVTLPASIASGDLLVIFFAANGNGTTTTASAGWSTLSDEGGDANDIRFAYRLADGTEGSTVTFTTDVAVRSASIAWRISGAESPNVQAPERASTTSGGPSSSPDPPSLTPTGGAKNYLWLAANASRATGTTSAAPASYSNLQTATTTGSTNDHTHVGAAERSLNAASTDPGAFTLAGSQAWQAMTFAIHPRASTNARLNAVEGVRVASTPGASSVTVTARFLGYLTTTDTATLRLRIHNNTDNVAVSNTTLALSLSRATPLPCDLRSP